MAIRIAVNGFGRIGRQTVNIIFNKHPELELVAINDLTDNQTLAHLFKYDSLYGRYPGEVRAEKDYLIIDGKKIFALSEREPSKLPWKKLGVEIVIESTGVFRTYELAHQHIEAGAKKVIISAPGKGKREIPVFVLGVNEDKYRPEDMDVICMASCTTNCLAPILKVLMEEFGIERAFMSTVHSYTNDQKLLDLPHHDLRRARAAALSIIPTTTGAATAAAKTLPELLGKIDGISLRVPTPVVSIVDLTVLLKRETTKEEVNDCFKRAEKGKLKGILGTSEVPLVSVDYRKDPRSSIVDLSLTMVNKNLVKICSWYDNEWGYSNRLAEFTSFVGKKL